MSLPRVTPRVYERVVLGCVVALVAIVITGGAVRVTGSGLGCPDWPTCQQGRVVAELQLHPMIEFVNRVFTGLVVVAVAIGVLASLFRAPRRRDLTWWSVSLVAGVIAQAVLGGVSVLVDLDPPFVMAHFLLSLVVVWAALVLYRRARQPDGERAPVVHKDYLWLSRAIVVMTVAVLSAGTVVTASGPHGGDPNARRFGFSPHDVTKVHGALVWILLVLVILTVWRLHAAGADKVLVVKGEAVMAALLIQGAIGYIQYALNVPAALVLLHIAGATAVWISVVWFTLSFYERWEPIGLKSWDGAENA